MVKSECFKIKIELQNELTFQNARLKTVELSPEEILNYSKDRTYQLTKFKYNLGQIEHGGIVSNRDCLAETEMELIDALIYVHTEMIKRAKNI